MPYTRLGTLIAGAAFILGSVQIAMGLGVVTGTISAGDPVLLLGNMTAEQTIDSGLLKILAADMDQLRRCQSLALQNSFEAVGKRTPQAATPGRPSRRIRLST